MASSCCTRTQTLVATVLEYDTPKQVHIHSKSIGIFNRVVQLLIIGYIIGWVFIYKQGYQFEDIGVSGTTTKVKGVTYADFNNSKIINRVWDTTDIVVPAEENNAFFVTTNAIVTNHQTPGECPEMSDVVGANCTSNTDCPVGKAYLLGHGVNNGTCASTGTCIVHAWCPIEDDSLSSTYAVLNGTYNFTVLIKNNVFFPFYNKRRSNILESTNASYLQNCRYQADADPFCPVFTLGYIVDEAHLKAPGSLKYEDIAYIGEF